MTKMFDSIIDDLCFKILKSLDDVENQGTHMDFIIDDYADQPITLIVMAVNKLEEQGYVKTFKGDDYEKNNNDRRVYPGTYTGDGKEQ